MKLTSFQFSFGFSLLVHALVLGAVVWRGSFIDLPEIPREDSLVTLTMIAAPPDAPHSSDERSINTVPLPPPVPPLPPAETPQPNLPSEVVVKSPEPLLEPVASPPAKPAAVVSIVRPPVTLIGDGTSPEPGLDAITQKVQVGIHAAPYYLKNPEPLYPIAARRRHEAGTVLLAVKVTAQGRAAVVTLKQSSGYSLLDESALKALWEWEFVPARNGSVAVESQIEVPVVFKLNP